MNENRHVWTDEYEAVLRVLIEMKRARYVNGYELTDTDIVTNACQEFSTHFHERFPELRLERGWYNGVEHWWLVTPDGAIVDPTRDQFPDAGKYGEYSPHSEGKYKARVGRCANCGDYIYEGSEYAGNVVCSDACHRDYASYLGTSSISYRNVTS